MNLSRVWMLLVVGLLMYASADTIDVVHLDSASFEHDTQAATGATTGDWLVKFYTPESEASKEMAEAWGELALNLKDRLTVAEVDCIESEELCRRFNVTKHPTLLFFRKGMVYTLANDGGISGWTEFVEGGFKSTAATPVPKPFTIIDKLV